MANQPPQVLTRYDRSRLTRGPQLLLGAAFCFAVACLTILKLEVVVAVVLGGAILTILLAFGPKRIAVAAWAGAAFMAPLNGVRISKFLTVSDGFLILAVGLTLISTARLQVVSSFVERRILLCLGVIATAGLIGTFFSGSSQASIVGLAKFVLGAGSAVAGMVLWRPGRREIRWFLSLWLSGAIFDAGYAVLLGPAPGGRALGFNTHFNHLGLVCVLGIGLAFGFALDGTRHGRRLAAVGLPLLGAALFATGSRAALLGVMAVVPIVAVLARRTQLVVRGLMAISIACVAVIMGLVTLPAETGPQRLLGGESSQGSDTQRLGTIKQNVSRLKEHPLTGEGFEHVLEAHNIYLQLAVAAGPLGLAGFLFLAGSALSAGRRGVSTAAGVVIGDHAVLAGLASGFAGYLVAGCFQNALWDRYIWVYIGASAALADRLQPRSTGLVDEREA